MEIIGAEISANGCNTIALSTACCATNEGGCRALFLRTFTMDKDPGVRNRNHAEHSPGRMMVLLNQNLHLQPHPVCSQVGKQGMNHGD